MPAKQPVNILALDADRSGLFDCISVAPEVQTRFPKFRLGVVFASGLRNGPSTHGSQELLRSGAARGIAVLGGRDRREHPSIRNWRAAYSSFGAKPSADPCSAEALLQRVLKSGPDSLPSISMLVDIYNSVCLAHLLPIGGEDLDRIAGG